MSSFGQYLRKLRGKKSLREVSQQAGVSHTYLSTLEKGYDPRTKKTRQPAYSTLKKLSSYYNVPYEEMAAEAGFFNREMVTEMLAKEFQKDKANAPNEFDIYKILDYKDYDVTFKGLDRNFDESEREAIAVTLQYILPLLERRIASPETIIKEIDELFYRLGGK